MGYDGTLKFDTKIDTKGFESGISKVGTIAKGALKATTAIVGAAATAITLIGGQAVKAGMQFDSSMSQVAATMGTTVDQIDELRDFAMEMGSTTAFSATGSRAE